MPDRSPYRDEKRKKRMPTTIEHTAATSADTRSHTLIWSGGHHRRASSPPGQGRRALGRWAQPVALAAILLGALLLRIVGLTAVPLGLHGDEAVSGLEAGRILREGNIGPYSPLALGQPTGPLYLMALSVALLGNTILAVRLVPVLLGVLTVLALFVVLRRSYGPAAALGGAALLATQEWHLHFSRIGFPLAAWPLCTVLAAGALVEARRRDDWRWWATTGLLLGLGLYAYNSHPLFLAIALLYAALAWVADWWRARRGGYPAPRLAPLLALPIAACMVAWPLLHFIADPANDYPAHLRQLSITGSAAWAELDGPSARAGFLATRYARYWDQLCCHPRVDGADGSGTSPFVPPPALALALAGAIIGCRERRGRTLARFGVLLAVLLPLGSVMTVDGLARRTFALSPFVALFIAVALFQPLAILRARGHPRWSSALGLASAAVVAFLAWGGAVGYFTRFAPSPEDRWTFAVEITDAARYLATLAPGSRVYFASGRWSGDYETRRFLAPGVVVEDRSREYGRRADLTVEPGGGPATFVLLGEYMGRLDELQARYPGGRLLVGGPPGAPSFVAYRVESPVAANP